MSIDKSVNGTLHASNKDNPPLQMTKLLIIKNVFILCAGVLLLFTAYTGLAMLQSTLNREKGIGVASQAVIYTCFCVSSLLFPKYFITKFGSKRILVFSMLTYIPYIASNFYPHWVLMIPASIIIGLGASLLWGSQANYLNDISAMYASIIMKTEQKRNDLSVDNERALETVNEESEYESEKKVSLRTWLNICNSKYQKTHYDRVNSKNKCCCKKEGCKLSIKTDSTTQDFEPSELNCDSTSTKNQLDLVKKYRQTNLKMNHEDFSPHTNAGSDTIGSLDAKKAPRSKILESTTSRFFGFHGMAYLSSQVWSNLISYYVLKTDVSDTFSNSSCVCGADFCNVESECFVDNLELPSDSTRYILTGICTCLAILSILIVALFLDPLETEKKKVRFTLEAMMATCKFAKRKELLLLIPLSLFIGMIQGVYSANFTKSYIGCAWGTYHVGLVSACYGFSCGVASMIAGWLVKQLGRVPIFIAAAVVNVAVNIFLLLWTPDREHTEMFFFAAVLWGVPVGIVWSQLRAFYGMLFKEDEEVAFAAFHVWYSLGLGLSFGYSNYLCTYVQIYILLIVSILGFIGYLLVEKIQNDKIKERPICLREQFCN